MNFSESDEDKLINIIAKNQAIYDAGHASYRNNLVKENIWKRIGQELNKNSALMRTCLPSTAPMQLGIFHFFQKSYSMRLKSFSVRGVIKTGINFCLKNVKSVRRNGNSFVMVTIGLRRNIN